MSRSKRLELSVIIADIISLSISYILASVIYLIILNNDKLFFDSSFNQSYLILLLSFFLGTLITLSKNKLFLKRDNFQELYNIIKNITFISMFFAMFVFIMRYNEFVSRGVVFFTILFYILIGYAGRQILKRIYLKGAKNRNQKLLIITTYEHANSKQKMNLIEYGTKFDFVGYAIVDRDCIDQEINGHKVIANLDTIVEYARTEVLDSVLLMFNNGWWSKIEDTVNEIRSMGIVVNFGIDLLSYYDGIETQINFVGDYPVLTYSENIPSTETLFLKRIIDIVGGIVGSIITLFVAIILGPIIKMESPGPVFFKQQRVGRNGRYFNIYKFRSMGVNAEQQKKELLKQNEVDGHMFKMTNDPRVTKVGKFIRATSIDELPQFFNVVRGEMSLVGTRPPTVDEFQQYSSHHKRRLSMKPGITGMWQVSGRSDITDFEEVVRLDTEYIDKFTLVLDFKILLKTVIVVFAKVGSR